jgi:hypothetical protein
MADVVAAAEPPPNPAARWIPDPAVYKGLVLAWAVTLAAAQVASHGFRLPRLQTTLESLVHLGMWAGLLSYAPMRAWVRGMPSPHRLVFAGFVLLMTFGQLASRSRGTFPFTSWTMYARAEPKTRLDYYRYRGIDASGREVMMDPAEVWTFVNSAEIASRVKAIGRVAIEPEDSPARAEARERVRDLLRGLMTTYDRAHPEAPLRSLAFLHYGWNYGAEPADSVAPVMILRVDAPDAAPPEGP